MKILGVSGSPIPDSNTDHAVQAVLAATGLETEFVKLSTLRLAPCTACLQCVKSNRCVIEDDGIALAEKAKAADALVIGGYTPYSSLDARTKTFLERLYPLRHQHGFMRGKPGVAVITSAIPPGHPELPAACQAGVDAIRYYMLEEGMEFVGMLKIVGNVPCVRCGFGDTCQLSGIKMCYGNQATVDSVGIRRFEKQQVTLRSAEELGRKLAFALQATGTRPPG